MCIRYRHTFDTVNALQYTGCGRGGWGDEPGTETRGSDGALGKTRSKAVGGGATMLFIISGSLKYRAICLRSVEFRGPRSCCTAIKRAMCFLAYCCGDL